MKGIHLVGERMKNGIERSGAFFSALMICLVLLSGFPGPADVLAQNANLLQPHHYFEAAKSRGDFSAAVGYGRQILALAEQQYGADSIEIIGPLKMLGEVLLQAGNFNESARQYDRAIAIMEREFGQDHPELVATLEALVDIRWQQKQFSLAETLLLRILSIEQSAYGEWHENVFITLTRLRELYQEMEQPNEVARIEATIESQDISSRDIDSSSLYDEPTLELRRYNADSGFATVRVFYGTNRARTGESKAAQFYGTKRGDLELGYLDVSIPKTHKYGELEASSRWSIFSIGLGTDALKNKYVLLLHVEPLNEQSFHSQLRAHVQNSPSNDIFLFVHGYNSSFSNSARRTAQLAYDLDFDGTPMMYSWPSQNSASSYTVDEAAVRVSGRKMARFLTAIVAQANADRIHIIAHSMGNRAVIEALETFIASRDPAEPAKAFDQIVFTAPDVDRDYFVDVIDDIKKIANRVTLYASENDFALKTSAAMHGAPRAGMAGESIIIVDGLDTIDFSAVDADVLGHAYFATNAGAIYDLFRLLWKGDPPEQRCGVKSSSENADSFWRFDVESCEGGAVLEAGLLIKRFGQDAREMVKRRLAEMTDDPDVAAKEEWSQILQRIDELLNADDV